MSHAPSREETADPMISGRYLAGALLAVTSPKPAQSRAASELKTCHTRATPTLERCSITDTHAQSQMSLTCDPAGDGDWPDVLLSSWS